VNQFQVSQKLQLAISSTVTLDQEEVRPEQIINLICDPQPEHDVGWDCFNIVYKVEKQDPVSLASFNYYFLPLNYMNSQKPAARYQEIALNFRE